MKMKKVFFALAVAGMFGLAACNNNKPAEEATEEMTETVEAAACCEANKAADEMAETVEAEAAEMTEAVEEVAAE